MGRGYWDLGDQEAKITHRRELGCQCCWIYCLVRWEEGRGRTEGGNVHASHFFHSSSFNPPFILLKPSFSSLKN
jgi:hypothetical protein